MIKVPDNVTHLDIDILARTIWGEARGESQQGRIAVGWVILNRTMHRRRWPDDVMGTCLEKYQFSCWLDSDPNRDKMRGVTFDDPVFRRCYEAAVAVCNGSEVDPTQGADHYHTTSISPNWADKSKVTCTIGHHRFYKLA